jgi:hypothetical protein
MGAVERLWPEGAVAVGPLISTAAEERARSITAGPLEACRATGAVDRPARECSLKVSFAVATSGGGEATAGGATSGGVVLATSTTAPRAAVAIATAPIRRGLQGTLIEVLRLVMVPGLEQWRDASLGMSSQSSRTPG